MIFCALTALCCFDSAAFGRPFYFAAPLKALKFASGFVGVTMMSAYLNHAQNTEENSIEFMQKALLFTALIFVNEIVMVFLDTQFDLYCEMVSINMRSGINGAVYQKVLRVPKIDDSGQVMPYTSMCSRQCNQIVLFISFKEKLPEKCSTLFL